MCAWTGAAPRVTQAPKDIHAVFAGGRVLVYGLLDTPTDLNVSLSLKTASGPKTFDVRAAADDIRRGHAVVTLAAGALIRDLEESDEWASGRGSRQRGRKAGAVAQEITRISKRRRGVARDIVRRGRAANDASRGRGSTAARSGRADARVGRRSTRDSIDIQPNGARRQRYVPTLRDAPVVWYTEDLVPEMEAAPRPSPQGVQRENVGCGATD